MQNIALKKSWLQDHSTKSDVSPWHVFAVVNISRLRKEDRRQANFFGGVHEVDNVVGVLEVESTAAPPRLVRVENSPLKEYIGESPKCQAELKPEWNNSWCHEVSHLGQDHPVPEPLLQLGGGGQLLLDALLHPLLGLLRKSFKLIQMPIEAPGDGRDTHSQYFVSCPNPYRPLISTWKIAMKFSAFLTSRHLETD